jgi:protein phosphatase
MGTTIAGVAVGDDRIVHFNVGDSRVYRLSDRVLQKLTHDDVPLGTKPGTSRLSHQITQSLGGRATKTPIHPHVGTSSSLDLGETLLLCSDGLTDMLPEEFLVSTRRSISDIENWIYVLLDQALEKGGRDNISIIAARISRG